MTVRTAIISAHGIAPTSSRHPREKWFRNLSGAWNRRRFF
jgi:hypothetical protein